jgi:hypothetical protein
MKSKAGIVLSLIAVAIAPLAASAQQAPVSIFATAQASAPQPRFELAQDPPSDRPEDVMSTSGMFLGIVGMLGGAVIGSALSQNGCDDDPDDNCRSRYAFTGALIAGTVSVPIGVHIANKTPGSLVKSLAVSALSGSVLYFATKAIPGEPIQIAPFLSAPIQMVTSVKIERGGKPKQ